MLVPIQTSGDKPPLFFVHGLHGVMPLGRIFAEGLGPDQPLYAIHANGIDGRKPVLDDLRKMVPTYVEEIQAARPAGPLVIGGMCDGTLAALEVARELQKKGRQVGPVILADPLAVPRHIREGEAVDIRKPGIARQLHEGVRTNLLTYASLPYHDMPFDASCPDELQLAVSAGVGALVALARHVPSPFPGPMQLIISVARAASFFHPQMPWHELLPGPRMILVLPWKHTELFQAGRAAVARALKFLLEEAPAFDALTERRTEPDAGMVQSFFRGIDREAMQQVQ